MKKITEANERAAPSPGLFKMLHPPAGGRVHLKMNL